MYKIKRVFVLITTLSLLVVLSSCDDLGKDTRDAATECCIETGEEYFDALIEGDYDTCEELSFYEEDYGSLHDYSSLEYVFEPILLDSTDSYNGYYIVCRISMHNQSDTMLVYFAYDRSEGIWKINAINDDYNTVTYQLERCFYEEDER